VADCPISEGDRAVKSHSIPAMIDTISTPTFVRRWRGAGRRVRAPLLHALASLAVAITVSVIIFVLWFPGALASVAGGATLFLILTSVDVISGPVLTVVVANPAKPSRSFRRDVFVIATVQLAALAYGVYVLSLARPVVMVFEVDRMRVLSAAEVDPQELGNAPEELRKLSWTGPRLVAAAVPQTREEMLKSIDLAIGGLDIGDVPKNWRPYESQATSAWNRAKPVPQLESRYPAVHRQLASVAARTQVPLEDLRFLPLIGRQSSGSVILAPPGARVVDVLNVDGFL
jgi:hypothetical protein